MVQALLQFDLNALFNALIQDVFILLFFIFIAIVLWSQTSFNLDGDTLYIKSGVFLRHTRAYTKQSISVLDIKRPLHYRVFGASNITIYFNNHALPKKVSFVLPKKTAENVSSTLMPLNSENSVFEPLGFERFVLILLSANILTTALLLWYTLQTISDFSGKDMIEVTQLAGENFLRFEQILEQFLPTGIAFLTALIFAVASISFLNSFFTTGGLRVCRSGGIILCECGIFHKTQRRISTKYITSCDVRITPTARILKRYAVYVTAGSFKSNDFPVMIIKKTQPHCVQTLLPDYSVPTASLCDIKKKSLIQYLYKPVFFTAICLFILYVAYEVMPKTVPVFTLAIFMCLLLLLQSIEGFFKEGVCKNENRTISLHYSKFFTLHKVCIFSKGAMYTLFQTPFGARKKYVKFYCKLPSGKTYKARGVPLYKVGRIKFVE